ncbi:MAG: SRPBCC family protein [Candidatus Dormibacteria bacterium]
MTSDEREGTHLLCSLGSADGKGVVRVEDRYDTDIEDLWSALTDPLRLARWYAEVEGDLRLGGEFRARVFASGWEGTGRVDACEPPRRLLVTMAEPGKPASELEATLAADGSQTMLVIERRGMALDHLAAYGAGWQIHVEDLAAYLAGRECCDADARWGELEPAYDVLAANVG